MKEIDAAAAAILNYFHVQVDPNAGTAEKLRVLESRQITTPLESLMEFTTTMSIFEATVKKGRFCVLQAEHAFGQYGEEAMPLEELKLYPELAQVAAELQRLLIWLNGDE